MSSTTNRGVRASAETIAQVRDTYRTMARRARYRPCAPGDGLGNIDPYARLDLEAEAAAYTIGWLNEEASLQFGLGCPNWPDRPALIYLVEAARNLCGGGHSAALHLLELAIAEIEREAPKQVL